MKLRSHKLADFRKLGKTNCPKPLLAKQLHETRQRQHTAWKTFLQQSPSVTQWLRNNRCKTPPHNVFLLPLQDDAHTIYKGRCRLAAVKATYRRTDIVSVNCGRYSSRCPYNRFEHTLYIESWAAFGPKWLLWHVDTPQGLKKGFLHAPRGWVWRKTGDSLQLVSSERCYELKVADLLRGKSVFEMVASSVYSTLGRHYDF